MLNRQANARLYLGVSLAFGTLYLLTAQHGPAWHEAGALQWRTVNFDLAGWLDLSESHPLLILLGSLLRRMPLGDLAWRINAVSAVCGALATANIALLVRRLTPQSRGAAWFAAGAFGLAHTMWWLASLYQYHTLYVMLFTLQLNLVMSLAKDPRPIHATMLGLTSGIGFSVDNLSLLMLPAYIMLVVGLCVRRRISRSSVPLLLLGWTIGSSLMLWLIWNESTAAGLATAIQSAVLGPVAREGLSIRLKHVALGLAFVSYNFPNLMLPLAIVGIAWLKKNAMPVISRTIQFGGLVYLALALRDSSPTQFTHFLPFYAVVAIFAGAGFACLARGQVNRPWLIRPLATASLLIGPGLYALAPIAYRAVSVPLPIRDDLPFCNTTAYFLTPWKTTEYSGPRFAVRALLEARDGDTIICDETTIWPLLWVRRFEGVGQGVRILRDEDARPGSTPAGHPRVFAVSSKVENLPPWIRRLADIEKANSNTILSRVRWSSPTTGIPGGFKPAVPTNQGSRPGAEYEMLVLDLGNNVKMKLRRIPAGRFLMGSPNSQRGRSRNESPLHEVMIAKHFYLGVYEVTRGQFSQFATAAGYQTDAEKAGTSWSGLDLDRLWWMPGYSWRKPSFDQTDDHPVVHVSWNDATEFCKWLSRKTGVEARLPTEAQWEYACRAGTKTAFPWGDNPDDGIGWCNASDRTTRKQFPRWPAFNWDDGYISTAPVGSYRPNAFGLYDMIGNVWDWCSDEWTDSYPNAEAFDLRSKNLVLFHVLRGGGWDDANWFCRSAERRRGPAYYRSWSIGFRLAVETK